MTQGSKRTTTFYTLYTEYQRESIYQMTYTTNQEVPTWEAYQTESMYDLNLPEQVISDSEQYFNDQLDVKLENPYSPYQQHSSNVSMLASPVMNMPILCRSYNPYSPAPVIQPMASHSPNTFVNSPGDSSTYSASPVNSPQHPYSSEELMMRYAMRHHHQTATGSSFPPRPQLPTNEYGYFYNEYGLKRRKRDDELTPEEYEKRRVRRERNKQAALRCRTRRRERIDALEQETVQIEEDNENVEKEIRGLKKQIEELQSLLKEHDCPKQLPYSGGNA